MRFTIQYFDRKASRIVRLINLLRFPPLLGGLILSFGLNNCPAAPDGAEGLRRAQSSRLPQVETDADHTNVFGISLLVKLMTDGSQENIVISPFSLELALDMVYAGCSGTSADELSRIVGFSPKTGSQEVLFPGMKLSSALPPSITLKIANSLWCDRSAKLQPTFEAKVKDLFNPEVKSVDLETAETMRAINDWVAKATENRITDLIQQPPKPPLVLIDGVYFKGAWEHPFSAIQDSPTQFNRERGGPCQVTMMKRSLSAPYLETDDFQAVKLPYNGGGLEMLLVLPAKAAGLSTVLQRLSRGSWNQTIDKFSEASGTISLPRFKATFRDSLVSPLTQLGIRAIFEPSKDFAPMFEDTRKFYVSNIIQQTYLRVDENGSEAAAATEVQIEASVMRAPAKKPFNLVFDRPFLFAIIDDQSGQLIFAGVLRDPDQAKLATK
ncbi:MAG: serpin family protein [Verrucomicrobia bacterium]|nr:serpin family protein [Verrucomicrobiota bacterium]